MNTEEQFLELIRADRENPAPRLIFADWLDDRGDPRGEFIRVQCELERQGLSALEQRWLRERERELLNEHEHEWLEPIARKKLKTAQWMFRRGFVEEVAIHAGEFSEFGSSLPPLFPLLATLSLRGLNRSNVSGVAASLGLKPFSQLKISTRTDHSFDAVSPRDDEHIPSAMLDAYSIKRLLNSDHLQNLRSLDLNESRFTESGFRAVLSCPGIRLRAFNLSGIELDMDWVRTLACSSCVKDLRELYLRATGLNINQILVLTYSDYLQQLETLDLRCNQFGSPREMQALVGMRRFPLLKHLDLTSCAVGDAGLKSLVKTPLWRQWETLVLWNNEITDRGVIEMAQAQPPAKLRALELRRNLIGDAGLAALSSSPVLSAFSELHLEHNRIEDAGTLALARSRHADNLRELHLRGNQAITDRGGIALAGAGFPALEVLDLAGTAVGDACAMALAEFPSSASLRVLDLGGTRITQTGALALAKSPHLGILEFLDLRMNHLKGDCVVALVERFGKRVLT
jgi:uncharacterized protein (TIGR02996 family)